MLLSFGDKLDMVQGGVLESATTDNVKLYKESPNLDETLQFLWSSGFKVLELTPNSGNKAGHINEVNVRFTR